MVAIPYPKMRQWLPPVGAVAVGAIVAIAAATMSIDSFEDIVWNSGLPALLPAAAPPLGTTARVLVALVGGLAAAAVTWSALFLLFGPGGLIETIAQRRARGVAVVADDETESRDEEDERLPTLRRADAHPDAPPRRPLSAKDLGVPMPPVEPIVVAAPPETRPIPADLDLPLAAFDPASVPAEPREPVRPVAPLCGRVQRESAPVDPAVEAPTDARLDPVEPAMVETHATTDVDEPETAVDPVAVDAPPVDQPPIDQPPVDTAATSIETLLERLERSTRNRRRVATK